jgi:hypothetical protein
MIHCCFICTHFVGFVFYYSRSFFFLNPAQFSESFYVFHPFFLSDKHILYKRRSYSLYFTFVILFKRPNTMASTYYIKAYYTKQDQEQPEIRRFAVRYYLMELICKTIFIFSRLIFHRKMMFSMTYVQKLHHFKRIINQQILLFNILMKKMNVLHSVQTVNYVQLLI